jgi:hypothetical protein
LQETRQKPFRNGWTGVEKDIGWLAYRCRSYRLALPAPSVPNRFWFSFLKMAWRKKDMLPAEDKILTAQWTGNRADSSSKKKRRPAWILLLIIALLALILTLIYGYFAFGPNDFIRR